MRSFTKYYMLLVAEIKHLNALMDNKPLVTLRQSNKYANNQPEKKRIPKSGPTPSKLHCTALAYIQINQC